MNGAPCQLAKFASGFAEANAEAKVCPGEESKHARDFGEESKHARDLGSSWKKQQEWQKLVHSSSRKKVLGT